MFTQWIGKNILIPTLQAIVGGAVMAAILGGVSLVEFSYSGCSTKVRSTVMSGHAALLAGNITKASSLASDSLILEPSSPCANGLAAEVQFRQMKSFIAKHSELPAEQARSRCFEYSQKAEPMLGSISPEIEAIAERCKAVP